ncbi:MAG: MMPL family transporter [Candidatus Thiodiazotropha sp. (ex Myrtea sp. 'scaly one' KF741663)]|nr:MMPL family transporter [Candidatus Thiodiazotropha sp. (ex Myrtea sp. 'scaly one' KF741663)]
MKWVISTAARYPWQIIVLLGLTTIVALTRLPDLRIEITAEGMLVKNPEALALYEQTTETFGSENVTVIYLEDEYLLEPKNLTEIARVVRKIETIPQVSHTSSLFSMRYLRTESGYVYSNPYLKPVPESREAARTLIDAALMNPLVERNLLSRDGTVMAINVYLDLSEYQRGFDESVATELDEAIAPLQQHLRTVFHLGDLSIRSSISQQIRNDQKKILPIALLVLLLTLGIVLRYVNAALIPLLTAGLSVTWTLSVMAVLAIPVNVITSIVPALLIIVGSTEDIHLISEYQRGIDKGLRQMDANRYMANHMGTAVLLTSITTCLGFLSISLNRIDLLQQFALITATGLLLNFIITVTLVPAYLQLFAHSSVARTTTDGHLFIVTSGQIFKLILKYPRTSLLCLVMALSIGGYWATRIDINNNVMDYFEPASPLPYQANLIKKHLAGIQTLAIVVSGEKDSFLQVDKLQQLLKLQRYLKSTGLFDKSFSFADYIGVIHSGIDDEYSGRIYLPDNDEVISSYMSLLGHANATTFVSEDYSQARVFVRHSLNDSKQLNKAVAEIKRYANISMDPRLDVTVTGSSYLNSQAVDYMAKGQTRSLALMLTVIFLLVSMLLSDVRIGLIAVAANLFPITILFGVMGLFNIPLDTGTVMVAAIALGICVDHTMHFMVRYRRLMRECSSELSPLSKAIQQESTPIITTAFALAMGFATLAFSTFPPVALFGLLSAMVMLLALIGTFIIIPLMLIMLSASLFRFANPVRRSDTDAFPSRDNGYLTRVTGRQ